MSTDPKLGPADDMLQESPSFVLENCRMPCTHDRVHGNSPAKLHHLLDITVRNILKMCLSLGGVEWLVVLRHLLDEVAVEFQ